MTRKIRTWVLAGLLATGSAALVTLSSGMAQAPKADPKAKSESKGKVVYRADKQGKFRFFIQDANGKTLAQSSIGYEKAEDALKMIDTVKTILNTEKPTLEKQ
jgi:uncharacterized protein YegP (UPF0339 family)